MPIAKCCKDASEFINRWVVPCDEESKNFNCEKPIKIIRVYRTSDSLQVKYIRINGVIETADIAELGKVKEANLMLPLISAKVFGNKNSKLQTFLGGFFDGFNHRF